MLSRRSVWLLFFVVLVAGLAKRSYVFHILRLACSNDRPDKVAYVRCSHFRVVDTPVLSAQFSPKVNVSSFSGLVAFDMLRKDNTKIKLFSSTVNGCEYLSTDYQGKMNILNLILQRIKHHSNLPKQCPIYAQQDLAITNLSISTDELPPVVPRMMWQLTIRIIVLDEVFGTLVVKGNVSGLN